MGEGGGALALRNIVAQGGDQLGVAVVADLHRGRHVFQVVKAFPEDLLVEGHRDGAGLLEAADRRQLVLVPDLEQGVKARHDQDGPLR